MLNALKGTLLHGWLESTLVQPPWRANRGNNTKLQWKGPQTSNPTSRNLPYRFTCTFTKGQMFTEPSTLCSYRTAPSVCLAGGSSITNSNSTKCHPVVKRVSMLPSADMKHPPRDTVKGKNKGLGRRDGGKNKSAGMHICACVIRRPGRAPRPQRRNHLWCR